MQYLSRPLLALILLLGFSAGLQASIEQQRKDFLKAEKALNKGDQVGWQKLQQKLVDWLAGKKRVKVAGPNIEMTLNIDGRTFVNSDGHHNMPSGEI